MRGYPLLQLFLVGCLFAAAGFPVWKVTHPAAAAAAPVPVAATAEAPPAETALELHASFAPAPADFRLSYLGRVVLEGRGPQAEFQGQATVTLPKDGGDFALEAHWTGTTTPAAARVAFRFPDGHAVERSVWSDAGGSMVELLTVAP